MGPRGIGRAEGRRVEAVVEAEGDGVAVGEGCRRRDGDFAVARSPRAGAGIGDRRGEPRLAPQAVRGALDREALNVVQERVCRLGQDRGRDPVGALERSGIGPGLLLDIGGREVAAVGQRDPDHGIRAGCRPRHGGDARFRPAQLAERPQDRRHHVGRDKALAVCGVRNVGAFRHGKMTAERCLTGPARKGPQRDRQIGRVCLGHLFQFPPHRALLPVRRGPGVVARGSRVRTRLEHGSRGRIGAHAEPGHPAGAAGVEQPLPAARQVEQEVHGRVGLGRDHLHRGPAVGLHPGSVCRGEQPVDLLAQVERRTPARHLGPDRGVVGEPVIQHHAEVGAAGADVIDRRLHRRRPGAVRRLVGVRSFVPAGPGFGNVHEADRPVTIGVDQFGHAPRPENGCAIGQDRPGSERAVRVVVEHPDLFG